MLYERLKKALWLTGVLYSILIKLFVLSQPYP